MKFTINGIAIETASVQEGVELIKTLAKPAQNTEPREKRVYKKKSKWNVWTVEDDEIILTAIANGLKPGKIIKKLPNHSINAIRVRYYRARRELK